MDEKWARLHSDLAAYANGGYTGLEVLCATRRSVSDKTLIPRMEACERIFSAPTRPETFDPAALSVLLVLVPAIQSYIGSMVGALTLLEGALESLTFQTRWEMAPPSGYVLQPGNGYAYAHWLNDRLHLDPSVCSEETIAECRKAAEARWPTATLGQRWTLARVFPENTAWAHEVVEQLLAFPELPIAPLAICEIVRDLGQAERLTARVPPTTIDYVALGRNLGTGAIPLLKAGLTQKHAVEVAHALASMDDPAAADALVACLGRKPLRPIAASYFERGSPNARKALEAALAGSSRIALIAQDLLARMDHVERAKAEADVEEASDDELPAVLVEAPWQKPNALVEAQQRQAHEPTTDAISKAVVPEMPESVHVDPKLVLAAKAQLTPDQINEATDDKLLEVWNSGQWYGGRSVHAFVLDRLGVRGIEAFQRFLIPELIPAISSARIANLVAARIAPFDWQGRSDLPCVHSLQWLRKNPEHAAVGLLPHLYHHSVRLTYQRLLAWNVDVAAILEKHYGKELAAEAMKIIEVDPRASTLPRTLPAIEDVPLETLARPRLKSGKRISTRAFRALLQLIGLSDIRYPHGGIAEVRAAFDAESLAELAWDLACAWELRQRTARRAWRRRAANERYLWLLSALVPFANVEVVRRLTPRFNGPEMVDLLGQIGVGDGAKDDPEREERADAAVLELLTIFLREKDKKSADLATRVHHQLDITAALKNLDRDELEERVLPDPVRVGASVMSGRPVIDYGPRHFEIRWTEDLAPALVVDDASARTAPVSRKRGAKAHLSRRLPAVRKTDDPAKVARAKQVWSTIVEDVAAVIVRRIELLGRAMASGRTWSLPELRARYLSAPLLAHLSRGLLFVREGDPASKAFRVAEDGSFADIDDNAFVVAETDRVRLIKPGDSSADEVARWREIFFDYGLVMPIAQLEEPAAPATP